MTGLDGGLTATEPIDLIPRRKFSRLSTQDERRLAHEVRVAEVRLPQLKAEFLSRNPERAL